jgi:hypothetical protein
VVVVSGTVVVVDSTSVAVVVVSGTVVVVDSTPVTVVVVSGTVVVVDSTPVAVVVVSGTVVDDSSNDVEDDSLESVTSSARTCAAGARDAGEAPAHANAPPETIINAPRPHPATIARRRPAKMNPPRKPRLHRTSLHRESRYTKN